MRNDFLLPVWAVNGRFGSAIDRPKQAAFTSESRTAHSLRSRAEAKRPLTSLNEQKNNRNKVLRDQNGHQNRSKALLVVMVVEAGWRVHPCSDAPFPSTRKSLGNKHNDGA